MSDILADYAPELKVHSFDPALNPHFIEDPPLEFSFVCPTCGKHRIEVGARRGHFPQYWRYDGALPALSIHPSIWSHGHAVWHEDGGPDGTGWFENIKCEWHRVIFKGRFIDELFAWPVEDPANAKFG